MHELLTTIITIAATLPSGTAEAATMAIFLRSVVIINLRSLRLETDKGIEWNILTEAIYKQSSRSLVCHFFCLCTAA